MSFNFHNLDEPTRKQMLAEIDFDVQTKKLYMSKRFKPGVDAQYEALVRQAAKQHAEGWLASEIRRAGLLKTHEEATKPKGGTYTKEVPVTAADTFADGEFNRFYARGLCQRAIAEGIADVVVYRAKQVDDPRPESEALIGKRFPAAKLLQDLRANPGVETALGRPNSGLSVRLP